MVGVKQEGDEELQDQLIEGEKKFKTLQTRLESAEKEVLYCTHKHRM